MAPSIPGSNCLTRAEDAIVALVANLDAFHEFIGLAEADAEGARAKIYVHDIDETAESDRDTWTDDEWTAMFPGAFVREAIDGDTFAATQVARDQVNRFHVSLKYSLAFEAYPDPNYGVEDQSRVFLNHVGNILEEMLSKAGLVAGEFAPMRITQASPFHRTMYSRRTHLGPLLAMIFHLERFIGE